MEKIIKRTLLIFLIGYLMYWFPFFKQGADGLWELKPFGETRIMGVLQRIALCYFFASIIFYYFSRKTALVLSSVILLAYWAILYLFGESGGELAMATNAVTRFDLSVLGNGHIYKRDSIPFDPEGLLSTLPSIVNVLAGYIAGVFVQQKGKTYEGISKLLVIGFVFNFIGTLVGFDFSHFKKALDQFLCALYRWFGFIHNGGFNLCCRKTKSDA